MDFFLHKDLKEQIVISKDLVYKNYQAQSENSSAPRNVKTTRVFVVILILAYLRFWPSGNSLNIPHFLTK